MRMLFDVEIVEYHGGGRGRPKSSGFQFIRGSSPGGQATPLRFASSWHANLRDRSRADGNHNGAELCAWRDIPRRTHASAWSSRRLTIWKSSRTGWLPEWNKRFGPLEQAELLVPKIILRVFLKSFSLVFLRDSQEPNW